MFRRSTISITSGFIDRFVFLVATMFCAAATVFLGFFPQPLLDLAEAASVFFR